MTKIHSIFAENSKDLDQICEFSVVSMLQERVKLYIQPPGDMITDTEDRNSDDTGGWTTPTIHLSLQL